MDLRTVLAIARRWFLLVVASTALAAAAAFAFSALQQKTYSATATLIVGQLSGVSADYNNLLVSQRLSTTYAIVATTGPNLEAVISKLGLSTTPGLLASRVSASAALDSTLVSITAQSSSAAEAAAVANALAEQLIVVSPTIRGIETEAQASISAELAATQQQIDLLQAQVDNLLSLDTRTPAQDATVDALQGRIVTLRSTWAALLSYTAGYSSNLLSIVDPAQPPTAPISPRVSINVMLGALLGFLFGLGTILIKEHLDDTIKTPEDAELSVGLPSLGVVRHIASAQGRSEIYSLTTLLYPRSVATESYRTLRANIGFTAVDEPIQTILVTSAVPGEGKTVTSSNLAVTFAREGLRVLLVDADLRKPGVHKLFDLQNVHGLTSVLRSGDASLSTSAQATEQANLWVLTTGPLPPNPAELLGSRRMGEVLDRMKADYDLVILDSPPVQSVADAAILSSLIDGTVLVVGAGKGHRPTVQRAAENLERAGAHVLGVVLNLIRDPARVASSGQYPSYGEFGEGPAAAAASHDGSSRSPGRTAQ